MCFAGLIQTSYAPHEVERLRAISSIYHSTLVLVRQGVALVIKRGRTDESDLFPVLVGHAPLVVLAAGELPSRARYDQLV